MNDVRVILDFPPAGAPHATGPTSFTHPREIVEARTLDEVRPALRRVQALTGGGAHAAGFVAYEAAPAFDPALLTRPHQGPAPLLWFGIFDAPEPAPNEARAADESLDWHVDEGRGKYDRTIAGIHDGIAAGDFYQVNYTLRFRATCDVPPASLYRTLAATRQGLYHALIETPAWSVVSASPELFLDAADGILTTRPMKGTHRRGRWLEEDRAFAATLAASAKDRAENLMIVDLLRNDLGRIAVPGSVKVPVMFDIETYPTVHQMTSTITAVPRDSVSLDDIFAATFPCGSVTGAPKIAAMRAIARIEDSPRGPYCGAIGVVRPDGSFTFNVGIRTLLIDHRGRSAVYGAGGGITWDSRASDEYDELTSKAALLTAASPAFELLETMRLDDGAIPRLELHLARLRASAAFWNFARDTADRARAVLDRERRDVPAGSWRVRLTATVAGDVRIERTPLTEAVAPCNALCDAVGDRDAVRAAARQPARGLPDVCLALAPVSTLDVLLFHKTTARGIYDRHRAAAPTHVHDVLLWNDAGEVTEFTTGNLVACIDGVTYTPPRTAGLLAGTMREELLRAGTIVERPLTPDLLRHASALWHVNSVRGCVRVRLSDPGCTKPPRPRTIEEAS